MSAVEMTSEHAQRLVAEFETYFKSNATNPKGKYKSFVLKGDSNRAQLAKLLELMDKNGIQYGKSDKRTGLKGYEYQTGKTVTFSTSDTDIILNAYQPKSVLTQVFFEPQPTLNDSITYDITSWALPYAYGVQAYALEGKLESVGTYFKPSSKDLPETKTPVAYLAPWEGTRDAAFLAELLQAGIRVKYPELPFEIEGKNFSAGTLIITKGGNEYIADFDQKVRAAASKHDISLQSTQSGYVDKGKDFGSPTIRVIQPPKVALIGGQGTSSLSYGETWHFFEKDLNYPLSNLDFNELGRVDLSKYNVIILPATYGGGMSESIQKKLIDWVKAGGKLIAFDNAVNLFANKEGMALKTYDSEEEKKTAEKAAEALAKSERVEPFVELERLEISEGVAGAIYEVQMDQTHPLGYGTGGKFYTLKNNSNRYALLMGNVVNSGIITSTDAYRSGYIGYKIKSQMAQSLVFGIENQGRGELVYFVDNPIFRGFWESGKLILSNAIFLVGQ